MVKIRVVVESVHDNTALRARRLGDATRMAGRAFREFSRQHAAGNRLRGDAAATGYVFAATSVALSDDGRFALPGSIDRTLRLWNLSEGRRLRTFEGHGGGVTSVALSADGRFALSGSDDRSLRLWDLSESRCVRIFEAHSDVVTSVSLSADGRFALSGSRDKSLRLGSGPRG